jgi:hypothetical protein
MYRGVQMKQCLDSPTIHSLSKSRSSTFAIQPTGYTDKVSDDLWMHMEFDFHAKVSDVVVVSWWVTDVRGVEQNLSRMTFDEVQFLVAAMTEELTFHKQLYYETLESEHYAFHPTTTSRNTPSAS